MCYSSHGKAEDDTVYSFPIFINSPKADLLTVERIGKYTYFKRNEETLREIGAFFNNEI